MPSSKTTRHVTPHEPKSRIFKVIVFDLDDTILDTSKLLLPNASREACLAMIKAGLTASLESALACWKDHGKLRPRQSIFDFLVENFNSGPNSEKLRSQILQAGQNAFFNRTITEKIEISAETRALLGRLRDSYKIYLVTSGHKTTQEKKVDLLDLKSTFSQIYFVDPTLGETKTQAFQSIATHEHFPSSCFLSVGNRLDSDIREARKLGWKGCWIKYGEYAHQSPISQDEEPDYVVNSLSEIEEKCLL